MLTVVVKRLVAHGASLILACFLVAGLAPAQAPARAPDRGANQNCSKTREGRNPATGDREADRRGRNPATGRNDHPRAKN